MTTTTKRIRRRRRRRPKRRPATGWKLTAVFDLNKEDPLGLDWVTCWICSQPLRYVHVVEHADWPRPLTVGRTCAERLCCKWE